MSDIESTDRQALGIPYPDVATMCKGDCEGTGWVPIHSAVAWHETRCLVKHFVKCPDCGGTGRRRTTA